MLQLLIDQVKMRANLQTLTRFMQEKRLQFHLDMTPVGSDEIFLKMASELGIRKFASQRLADFQVIRRYAEETLLLRPATPAEAAEVVRSCDISCNSEWTTLCALSDAAVVQDRRHKVILLLEMGDLSFGAALEDLLDLLDSAMNLRGIRIVGLATSFGQYGRTLPELQSLKNLADLARAMEARYFIQLPLLSLGGSAVYHLLDEGVVPTAFKHVLIDQTVFTGRETAYGRRFANLHQDCFTLRASVVESQRKASMPAEPRGLPAHVRGPEPQDEGMIRRAILDFGHADIAPENCHPLDQGLKFLGACEDFSIFNVSDYNRKLKIGDTVDFALNAMGIRQALALQTVRKTLV